MVPYCSLLAHVSVKGSRLMTSKEIDCLLEKPESKELPAEQVKQSENNEQDREQYPHAKTYEACYYLRPRFPCATGRQFQISRTGLRIRIISKVPAVKTVPHVVFLPNNALLASISWVRCQLLLFSRQTALWREERAVQSHAAMHYSGDLPSELHRRVSRLPTVCQSPAQGRLKAGW